MHYIDWIYSNYIDWATVLNDINYLLYIIYFFLPKSRMVNKNICYRPLHKPTWPLHADASDRRQTTAESDSSQRFLRDQESSTISPTIHVVRVGNGRGRGECLLHSSSECHRVSSGNSSKVLFLHRIPNVGMPRSLSIKVIIKQGHTFILYWMD